MPKANMMIIRGKDGKEFVSESWSKLEHHAYTGMAPKRVDKTGDYFDLVLLVPGREPIKCEVEFIRGCNAFAIPADIGDFIPPEFRDPMQAMEYALKHGLDTPPVWLPGDTR